MWKEKRHMSAGQLTHQHTMPSGARPEEEEEWPLHNLDLDPEEPLGDDALAEITGAVQDGTVAVMLWESEPLSETVDALAEHGVTCVIFSPCEMLPESRRREGDDYLRVMTRNIARLEQVVKG